VENDGFCVDGFAWRGFAMCTWNCIETPYFLQQKYSTDTAAVETDDFLRCWCSHYVQIEPYQNPAFSTVKVRVRYGPKR